MLEKLVRTKHYRGNASKVGLLHYLLKSNFKSLVYVFAVLFSYLRGY